MKNNTHGTPNPKRKINNHRCPDWYELLIDDSMLEYEACPCPKDAFGYLKYTGRCEDLMCACHDKEFLD